MKSQHYTPFLTLLLPLALAACGGGGSDSAPAKPSAVTIQPQSFSANQALPVLAQLNLTSSAALKPESVTNDHVQLERFEIQGQRYYPVMASASYNASTQQIQVKQAAPLEFGAQYRVRLHDLVDADGLVVPEQSVSFRGEKTVKLEETFNNAFCYSAGHNRAECAISSDPKDLERMASKITYSYNQLNLLEKQQHAGYSGNFEFTYTYTSDGLVAQINAANSQTNFSYDNNKRLQKLEELRKEGSTYTSQSTESYSYEIQNLLDGSVSVITTKTITGGSDPRTDKYEQVYNLYGHPLLFSFLDSNGKHTRPSTTYQYNPQGQLLEYREVTADPTQPVYTRYKYSSEGLLQEVNVFYQDINTANTTYQYNTNKQLIETREVWPAIKQDPNLAAPIPSRIIKYTTLP